MSSEFEFVRLLKSDGTWDAFCGDWKSQCDALGEDFEGYTEATFSVVDEIVTDFQRRSGVFALRQNGSHLAMCQVNLAALPGYEGPVLRVRFITLSPEYDLTNKTISEYGDVLVGLLGEVLELAYLDEDLTCRHIKFHLSSPADQQFFRALGMHIQEHNIFEKIETRGSWLYITRK